MLIFFHLDGASLHRRMLYWHYPGAVEIPQKLSLHEIINLHSSSTPCLPKISEIQAKYDQQ
jgi:hypothetical protein